MFMPNCPFDKPKIPIGKIAKLHFDNEFTSKIPQVNNENEPQTTRQPMGKACNPRFRTRESMNERALKSARVRPFDGRVGDPSLTPKQTIIQYGFGLSEFEKKEINDFDEIFFIGRNSKSPVSKRNNYGFDDNEFHLKVFPGDHLAYRFEVKEILGKGAFGQVIRAYDHKHQEYVALKVIINTAQMHEQGRIEVSIIQKLNQAEGFENCHIIEGKDFFVFRNHICATFEILGQNLYEYSRSLRFRPLGMGQLRTIAYEMLVGIAFIHQHKVIHADLKPENVLLLPNSTRSVKIIDFGSSCFIGHAKYEYIQSRYYRAPEVILGIPYGPPMDIWSFACIIGEMMMGQPMFPGENEQDQLDLQMEALGPPPINIIQQASRKREFFDFAGRRKRSILSKRRPIGSQTIGSLTRIKDHLLVDLLTKCLAWDQNERITAAEALKHPWFTNPKKQLHPQPVIRLPEVRHT